MWGHRLVLAVDIVGGAGGGGGGDDDDGAQAEVDRHPPPPLPHPLTPLPGDRGGDGDQISNVDGKRKTIR